MIPEGRRPHALERFGEAVTERLLGTRAVAEPDGAVPAVDQRNHDAAIVYANHDSWQAGFALMSVGIYLAIIMFLNVWGVIWPNQKRALGIVEVDADAKAKAAKMAMLFSRINTLLIIPMLACMTMYQTLFG